MIEPTGKLWETIYSQNIGKWIGICYRYTANRQLAEDLAHDAFLKAIDRASSFEGRGSIEAWLRRIVVNHALQYLRDRKRAKFTNDWTPLLNSNNDLRVTEEYEDTSPGERAEFTEQELLEVINQLPEHHRLVFNLYVIDHFTHVRIGEELGISVGTSKSHLARARKKIQQLLLDKASRKRSHKRGILFLLLLSRLFGVDRLYSRSFDHYAIPAESHIGKKLGEVPKALLNDLRPAAPWSYMIAATTAGILLVVAYITFTSVRRQQDNNTKPPLARITATPEKKEPSLPLLKNIRTVTTPDSAARPPYNSVQVDSGATLLQASVIQKNINTKSMKTLDSLAMLLLMSSSAAFDATAQTQTILATSAVPHQVQDEQSIQLIKSTESAPTKMEVNRRKKDKGKFYASSLFWSAEDNEVYFKGKIMINYPGQRFIATGSCTFLGPVYLLIVDGVEVKLNDTIKLASKQYSLVSLDTAEALEKYGDKGKDGAIEIAVID